MHFLCDTTANVGHGPPRFEGCHTQLDTHTR